MFLKMMGVLKIAQEEIDLMFDLSSALKLSIETPNSMTRYGILYASLILLLVQ